MKRRQMVLDWVGHWLDGEETPRVRIVSHVHQVAPEKSRARA